LSLNEYDFPTLDSIIDWAKEMYEGYVANEQRNVNASYVNPSEPEGDSDTAVLGEEVVPSPNGKLRVAAPPDDDWRKEMLAKYTTPIPVEEAAVAESLAPNEKEIRDVCRKLADFLVAKNAAYGDSAINPLRVLSKADPAEQIRVRMDDKISRLVRGQAAGEDAIKDLVGYWVLLQVCENRARETKRP
jgi:hypothetical protein